MYLARYLERQARHGTDGDDGDDDTPLYLRRFRQRRDTESITDTIQTKLIKSGKFRFVDMTAVKQVQEQLDFQTDAGMVNPATAVKIGQQIGAEYMLYGNMASIVKQSGNTREVYYKFTLKLQHLQSGIVEWQDEKEIRKTKTKSLLGL